MWQNWPQKGMLSQAPCDENCIIKLPISVQVPAGGEGRLGRMDVGRRSASALWPEIQQQRLS